MANMLWAKFYWTHWLSDVGLRRCSVAARGLWMDMLCIAAQHDPVGYVAVNDQGCSPADLARLSGLSESEVQKLLGELQSNDVFSRDRRGIIYNRRMIKDRKKRDIARENGKLGGNPNITNPSTKSQSDNHEDNSDVNGGLNTQEAKRPRSQETKISPVVPVDELEWKLRQAAGWENEPAPMLAVTGPIQDLLDRGADLNRDVLPVVKALARQARSRTSWKYFVSAIAEAHQTRISAGGGYTNGLVNGAPVPDEKWLSRLELAREKKQWDAKWGPWPNQLGCRVPAYLVKAGDGQDWLEWKPSL